jgi:hypothetical protein
MTLLVLALVLVCECSWRFLSPTQALLLGLAAAAGFVVWLLQQGRFTARTDLPA